MEKQKKPTKMEEMTKEQIRQAILKKRECNKNAIGIVENLLESCVTSEFLVKCLPHINQSHFEDVIEERSIIHLCGYPICDKKLSQTDIPKQKYRISMKSNKVYDITARKSFCSNSCYQSAMHVKKQMLTSPLWFREYEEIPQFHLLPLESAGSLGQEIDLAITEKINVKKEKAFTSINDFTKASLQDLPHEVNCVTDEEKNKGMVKCEQDTNSIPEESNNIDAGKTKEEETPIEIEKSKELHGKEEGKGQNRNIKNPLNIVGEIIEKPERKIDPILASVPASCNNKPTKTQKPTQKKEPSVAIIAIEVEKCLAEWFTIDTMLLLFGKDKVTEMVKDKGECIREYLNNYAKGIFYNSNTYDQYQELCRKLNMLELEDKQYDAQTLHKETKPLPDYKMLQEESKKMQLKVKAFFAGETVVPNIETVEEKEATTDGDNKTLLPLVDRNAQNALRRRIVCQHLNKVLPDLLKSLGLLSLSINPDVRLLVNTFKLKANNIMFKPMQWMLIAIVIIKLLSLRDKRLEYLLEQPMAFQHMQLLLLSYKQDGGYLHRLISWLTDIDRLLDTNDTQLTVE